MLRRRAPVAARLAVLALVAAAAVEVVRLPASEPAAGGNGFYFGEPLTGLSPAELAEYKEGFARFIKIWPAVEGARINAQSCAACHRIPLPGGSGTSTDTFVLHSTSFRDIAGGTVLPRFIVTTKGVLEPLETTRQIRLVSRRKTQPLFGLGLLEAVEPSHLTPSLYPEGLPRGRLPCGIRGCGRFGWKSAAVTIDEFVERAFASELGLIASDDGSTPLSKKDVVFVSQFIRFLAAPPKLAVGDNREGRRLFDSCGCATCHRPLLSTGANRVGALAHREIGAFTDLLLHDMGGLDAQDAEGEASATEYPTAPLWGLRFTGPPYLHDGRAPSVESAIEQHKGEASVSSGAFQALSSLQRDALVSFLRSL